MLRVLLVQLILYIHVVTALKLTNEEVQADVEKLWKSDMNRAEERQVKLNFQGRTKPHARIDKAKNKFFEEVDEKILQRPTYRALIDLFDAYDQQKPHDELLSSIDNFLDVLGNTTTYRELREFLAKVDYEPAKNADEFRSVVHDIWFGDYSRGTVRHSSSGFEHVFIGEQKHGQIIGLHSWVRMHWLESKGELDYTGYMIDGPRVPLIQFKIGHAWKPAGSMMIGTSPEFDFSVFTLCFLGKQGGDACKFFLGDCTAVDVTSYPFKWKGSVYIGTVYPSAWRTQEACPMNRKRKDRRHEEEEQYEDEEDLKRTMKKFKVESEEEIRKEDISGPVDDE